jgi:hypothetical protein
VFYHPSFTRLNQANEITFYILVLLKIGQEVIGQHYHPLIHPATTPTVQYQPTYPLGKGPNPKAIAIEICHSVDCHLQDHHSTAGAFMLLFSLRVTYQFWEYLMTEVQQGMFTNEWQQSVAQAQRRINSNLP